MLQRPDIAAQVIRDVRQIRHAPLDSGAQHRSQPLATGLVFACESAQGVMLSTVDRIEIGVEGVLHYAKGWRLREVPTG